MFSATSKGYYAVCGGLGVDTLLRNERRHHHQSPAGLTLLFHPHSRSEPRLSAPAGPTRHKDEATRGGHHGMVFTVKERGSRRFSDRLATNSTNSYVERTSTQLTKHGIAKPWPPDFRPTTRTS
jgi:hypothetical protein